MGNERELRLGARTLPIPPLPLWLSHLLSPYTQPSASVPSIASTASTSVDGSPSRRTTTCHSGSAQAHVAVRFSRESGAPSTGKKMVVGAGSANMAGGARGACEALHHEGRSPGRSAAVQSSPIHQRWFSYDVKAKRSFAVTVALAVVALTTGPGIGEGKGIPESPAQQR
jgi:hypothetical protein